MSRQKHQNTDSTIFTDEFWRKERRASLESIRRKLIKLKQWKFSTKSMSTCICTSRQKKSGKPSRRCQAHQGYMFPRPKVGVMCHVFTISFKMKPGPLWEDRTYPVKQSATECRNPTHVLAANIANHYLVSLPGSHTVRVTYEGIQTGNGPLVPVSPMFHLTMERIK